eukprot:jgi/Mesen1/10386/ME000081S09776
MSASSVQSISSVCRGVGHSVFNLNGRRRSNVCRPSSLTVQASIRGQIIVPESSRHTSHASSTQFKLRNAAYGRISPLGKHRTPHCLKPGTSTETVTPEQSAGSTDRTDSYSKDEEETAASTSGRSDDRMAASESPPVDAAKKGLGLLNAYFDKLEGTQGGNKNDQISPPLPVVKTFSLDSPKSSSLSEKEAQKPEPEHLQKSPGPEVGVQEEEKAKETKERTALKSLDAYFDLLNPPPPEPEVKDDKKDTILLDSRAAAESSSTGETAEPKEERSVTKAEEEEVAREIEDMLRQIFQKKLEEEGNATNEPNFNFTWSVNLENTRFERFVQRQSQVATPFVGNALVALNVAVFLFELASPQVIPGDVATSLPSLFMAKHNGFLHVGLGSFCLLSLAPVAEVAFGPLSFLGAYFCGGLFGDFLSFIQTPAVTVGGTGPLYGLVGAWIVFLLKNREMIGPEEADNELRIIIFFAALNVAIGNPLPIDNWSHIGGVLGGLIYGGLAAPTIREFREGETKPDQPDAAQSSSLSDSQEDLLAVEGPDNKQVFWITALCAGIVAMLYNWTMYPGIIDFSDITTEDLFW